MKKLPIALLLSAALFLALSCGRETPGSQQNASYAAFDLERALAAHHLYPDWQAAANSEAALQKSKEEKSGLLKARLLALSEIKKLGEIGLNNFAEAALAASLSELRLEERTRLDEVEQREKRARAQALQKNLAAVEEEYRLPLFNLKTNIEAIAPLPRRREESREQKERLLAAIEAIRAEKNAKMNALCQEADLSMRQTMKSNEEESALRGRETERKLRQGNDQAFGVRLPDPGMPETVCAEIAALEKGLTEQKILKDRLYSRMYEDIASQAARIAAQNKYAAVFADVKINITARDITDEIIAGLPENKRTQ